MNASAQLERCILAACLRSPDLLNRVQATGLEPGDFYDPQLGTLYDLLCQRAKANRFCTMQLALLLVQRAPAEHRTRLPSDGEIAELDALPTGGCETWAYEVAEDARRRRLCLVMEEATTALQSGAGPIADTISFLGESIRTRRIVPPPTGDTSLATPLRSVVVSAEDALYGPEDGRELARPILTGFAPLDHIIGGQLPGELGVIMARTSMGKTALACNIAVNVAEAGQHVLVYSLEDPAAGFARRVLCARARVPIRAMRMGDVNEAQMHRLQRAEGALVSDGTAERLHVVADPTLTVARIDADLTARRQRGDTVHLVIIDYLQLLRSPSAENEQQRLTNVSSDAVALAKTCGLPVIALAQANRGSLSRQDKRPTLGDIRGSDAIGQAADQVLIVHRESYYDPMQGPGSPGEAEVIVAKNRSGMTGTARLWFELGSFAEERP